MGTHVETQSLNLRPLLFKLMRLKPSPKRGTITYTGDSSTTSFEVPAGHKATAVYSDGARRALGSARDYTLGHDGFKELVKFNVAPASVYVIIDYEEVQ